MPLFYQHNINGDARIAVWHITEDENFFIKRVSLKKTVTHPHKRLQHLAGRYLLQELEPGFPLHLIEISETKKPLLSNGAFHFSISHCGDYAAVIVSDKNFVGVDVELVTPKIEWVKDKFLTETELEAVKNATGPKTHTELLTLAWSAKEAIFKWYGMGLLSFRKNMQIIHIDAGEEEGRLQAFFIKGSAKELSVGFRFFGNLCLAWIIG